MYVLITIFLIVLGLFWGSFFSPVFLAQRSFFSICCKAVLVVLNSLSICLSEKVLISVSNLNEILAGQNNLGFMFFSFITLSISCHSLLACRVSAEKSADNLMGIPLYVTFCFSFAVFNIFSLNLIFVSLINMFLLCFSQGLSCMDSLRFLDLGDYFLSHVREVFHYNLFKYFSDPFFFFSSSGTPIIRMLVHLILSQRSLRLSLILFILFSLFSSAVVISTILPSRSLTRSSASVILLLIPSRVF